MVAYFAGFVFSLLGILFAGATGASEHDPKTQTLGAYLTFGSWLLSITFFALAVWL